MKTVYQATNGVDASVVANLLARFDIEARVVGQELGPYTHALGAVRVVVEQENEARARSIIGRWERQPEQPRQRLALSAGLSRDGLLLVAGFLLLLAVIWYFTGGPGAY